MHAVREFVRRYGIVLSAMAITVISMALSGLVSSAIMIVMEHVLDLHRLAIGLVIPLVIAPPFSWVALSLIHELDQTQAELRRLSNRDALTGVNNRRMFMQSGKAEIARVRRYGGSLGLIMLDSDNLKQVNDSLGHLAGDALLVDVAQTCAVLCRENDVFARLGGDEFAFLIPNATEAGMAAFAARVLDAVHQIRTSFNDTTISARLSLGAALLCPGDTDLTQLMYRADQALYEAKRAGGDAVTHDRAC